MSAGAFHRVRGQTLDQQAITLAGALAEMGVQALTLDGQELRARVTDLPGALRSAEVGGELCVRSPTLVATRTDSGWVYQTDDPDLSRRLMGDR
jgi:hypothetical protein